MPKQVKVEGQLITVPDDATPDEIDQVFQQSSGMASHAPTASAAPQSAWERFAHSAGMPAHIAEVVPALKGLVKPEQSPTNPGAFDTVPIVGGMFRAQRETFEQPGAAAKVYGSIPVLGPVGYQMGKQLENTDLAGAAGSGLNIIMQMMGGRKLANKGVAPVEPQVLTGDTAAARGITRALNIAEQERPSHMASTAAEAGNIQEYASRNKLPLTNPRQWAVAARGSAQEAHDWYKTNMEVPAADKQISVTGAGYHGATVGEGQNATISQVSRRIDQINNELRQANIKKETGQVMTALANESELKAEAAALQDRLYQGISDATGFAPDEVKAARQRFGRQYQIADQTDAAVNSRERRADMNREGRTDVPMGKVGVVTATANRMRGGPEGISARSFRKALDKSSISSTVLPESPLARRLAELQSSH